jgi:hypothetical protein
LEESRVSTASDFLCYLLDSIRDPELLTRFKNINWGDPLAVMREVLDTTDETLCDALERVLEEENNLGIVANLLGNVRGRGGDFVTTISSFIGRLSEKTTGLKALLTCGPADDSTVTLGELPCIKIQYDKERKGVIILFHNTKNLRWKYI